MAASLRHASHGFAAVTWLVLSLLTPACHSPTRPSRAPTTPDCPRPGYCEGWEWPTFYQQLPSPTDPRTLPVPGTEVVSLAHPTSGAPFSWWIIGLTPAPGTRDIGDAFTFELWSMCSTEHRQTGDFVWTSAAVVEDRTSPVRWTVGEPTATVLERCKENLSAITRSWFSFSSQRQIFNPPLHDAPYLRISFWFEPSRQTSGTVVLTPSSPW